MNHYNIDFCVEKMIRKLKKEDEGYCNTTARLLNEVCPDFPFDESDSTLMKIEQKLIKRAEKEGIILDKSHHENKIEGLPYNLDFVLKRNNALFITITGTNYHDAFDVLRIGDEVMLKKDFDNLYDDEAIRVCCRTGENLGYVANSVSTVARGTHSAGYIYRSIDSSAHAVVRFIYDKMAIAEIML